MGITTKFVEKGGQGVIVKLMPESHVEKMRVKNGKVSNQNYYRLIILAPVVLKMACGENPKSVYGRGRKGEMPSTRMGSAWMMRKRFEEARAMMKLQNKFCANMTSLTEYVSA